MGSRRARRSHGRVQSLVVSKKTQTGNGISKLARKKASRIQQKSAILMAARAAREAAQSKPPLLCGLLSVSGAGDEQLELLSSKMRATDMGKIAQPFETFVVRQDGIDERISFLSALDMAKVADIVLLVFSGNGDPDEKALNLLTAMRAQGLPSLFAVAIGEGANDPALRKLRGRQLAAESIGDDHSLRPIPFDCQDACDTNGTNHSAMRRIFSKSPRAVSWRSRYGYMRVEGAAVQKSSVDGAPRLVLAGWIRGRGFSANELVHLTGFGTYCASQIVDVQSGAVVSVRSEVDGEPVESEAVVDDAMGEQTWPPEVDACEEEEEEKDVGKALAEEFDAYVDEQNRLDGDKLDEPRSEHEMEEELDVVEDDEMQVDEDDVREARKAAQTDAEFPDEVDTPESQPARVRFARYRGLKSLRTGDWDPKEQLPPDYATLFQFRNLASTRKGVLQNAMKEATEAATKPNSNFVVSGRKVYIELLGVDDSTQKNVMKLVHDGKLPVVASGMLRHENRKTVIHFGLERVDEAENAVAVKAKSHLEMHCGFVRFEGRPMFSENNANCDKHKMERFLQHGRYTVASFYGPAIFAPAPALLCYPNGSLIATGSTLGADPDRIMLKRIILTGYPFKTQKRRTVAKLMFFNADDVRWFKPVELWTKLGRTGHILEPVGTHGHMKCTFDNVIMHHDTVCMTLYKRVYPKVINEEEERTA